MRCVDMTHQERQAIKHRYVIDGKAVGAVRSMPVRKMTESERQLLRRQIMEVHVEIVVVCPITVRIRRTARNRRFAHEPLKE